MTLTGAHCGVAGTVDDSRTTALDLLTADADAEEFLAFGGQGPMLVRFNPVRVGHGEARLLVTVLAGFLGGVHPFGGFGRVMPVGIGLVGLQVLGSGLNLPGANQHQATAVWGLFLTGVMVLR